MFNKFELVIQGEYLLLLLLSSGTEAGLDA
jgi:hypothetical protein